MLLHGLLSGSELSGHLFVQQARGNKSEDFALSWRQSFVLDSQFTNLSRRISQLDSTLDRTRDCLQQLIPLDRFFEKVNGARFHRAHAGQDVAIPGDKYDREEG